MEKYLSIYDSEFKLCDEDSRISTDMETKPPFFAKKRAAKSASSQTPHKICEICEIREPFKTRREICELFKSRRNSAREKHKMETTSDETSSSEAVL